MNTSTKNVIRKKGRPPTGTDPMLAGRVPAEMIKAVVEWAAAKGVSRSEAIRRLIQKGLETTES
ncbi:CopG family transcriptional regulator [Gluconobacter sp. R75690]|uniref:ribbon-helix-helix domain-containing protein n=1 Tax=Gluconobacter TaxID=441 RepID=UPI00188B485F|nr:CopG family transcriptional regulator [Gluconobacter sp. R75690]MBF0879141.1 CopG family transcriptional regulator [Gluconobacter sp. R75828]